MSDMKCPFCQDYLIPCIKNQNDWIYHCDNQKCPMYDDADNENAKHLLASEGLWQELIRTRKALDKGMEHITGLNNMIESWLNLINSDLDQETKLHILKSAISAYVENKGGNNEK